jgi:CHAD domain-containing protein
MAIHDMRVASRRLRAAIGVFGPAFEGKSFDRFESEVKAVTDALSAARDLDVMIETLEQLEAGLPENERGGLESFINELREKRSGLQKHVRNSLEHMHRIDLQGWFDSVCGKDEGEEAPQPESSPTPAAANSTDTAAQ